MADPRTQRGDPDRGLDPLLSRALERLRAHMAEKGITQAELGRRSGLTQWQISKATNGLVPEVSFYVLARIFLAAQLSMDWAVSEPPGMAQMPITPVPSSSVVPSRPR